MALRLIVKCGACGEEVDSWDITEGDDKATHVCEIAGDLNFEHTCGESATVDGASRPPGGDGD